MTVVIADCDTCKGVGNLPNENPGERPCYSCNGWKVRSKRGTPYKTEANALKARENRTAEKCYGCNGTGITVIPLTQSCWSCRGAGNDVVMADPGDTLPEDFDRYRSQSATAAAHYAAIVDVVIQRHGDSVLTWGASMLGLGTVWTSTDYGDAFKSDDATVLAKVRASLSGRGNQWCKFAGKDRVIADTVLVSVTRNGYAVTTAASGQQRAMLPPTYTAAVLNAPYNH